MTAVYLTIVNSGDQPDRLVGAMTDVAEVAEIHQTRVEGGVAHMEPVKDGLTIPAEGQVVLEPGGYHIMLIGLKKPLQPGDRFTLMLHFEHSDPINVEVEVRR